MGNYGFNALKERKCKRCDLEWVGRMPCPRCSSDKRGEFTYPKQEVVEKK